MAEVEVCRFDEHSGECRWIACPNLVPGSPTGCPLPWPREQIERLRSVALAAEPKGIAEVLRDMAKMRWAISYEWDAELNTAADALAEQAETIEKLRQTVEFVSKQVRSVSPDWNAVIRWLDDSLALDRAAEPKP